jgi:hypothetical protein
VPAEGIEVVAIGSEVVAMAESVTGLDTGDHNVAGVRFGLEMPKSVCSTKVDSKLAKLISGSSDIPVCSVWKRTGHV